MRQYLEILRELVDEADARAGDYRGDRTGTGTVAVFERQMRWDLSKGFPLMTTKKLHLPSIIHELLWFLSGESNVRYLQENGVRIWNEWADENGDLGRVYGVQWRSWRTYEPVPGHNDADGAQLYREGQPIDQVTDLIEKIKAKPYDRRLIVSAWNVGEISQMALPPCHKDFQAFVKDGKLSLSMTQRSCDIFLGIPFNVACYSLLTHMLAQQCGLEVGEFIWKGGDVHLYSNHVEQAKTQLKRDPRPLPTLNVKRKPRSIFDYRYEDFEFIDYKPWPSIKGQVSV